MAWISFSSADAGLGLLRDALFRVVFADCLSAIRQRLDVEGLLQSPGSACAAQPTWADDLAVPIVGPANTIVAK